MLHESASWPIPIVLAGLTLLLVAGVIGGRRWSPHPYFRYLWAFFLIFAVAEWVSFTLAAWILALFAYVALREFFSLMSFRIQDRWGILAAYLSIPFMIYLIQIDWYGMFIISVPVYTFLLIPFLVALGRGEARGTVLSTGMIDFGLFLVVYCLGHIAYLTHFSPRMAAVFVAGAALADGIGRLLGRRGPLLRFAASAPAVLALLLFSSAWSTLPLLHAAVLGLMLPALVIVGHCTLAPIEEDLGIGADRLEPGRGQIFDAIKVFLFTAPVTFHYLRWFLGLGDLPAGP